MDDDGTTNLFGIGGDYWTVSELPTVVAIRAAVAVSTTRYELAQNADTALCWKILGPDRSLITQEIATLRTLGISPKRFPPGWSGTAACPVDVEYTASTQDCYLIEFQWG